MGLYLKTLKVSLTPMETSASITMISDAINLKGMSLSRMVFSSKFTCLKMKGPNKPTQLKIEWLLSARATQFFHHSKALCHLAEKECVKKI